MNKKSIFIIALLLIGLILRFGYVSISKPKITTSNQKIISPTQEKIVTDKYVFYYPTGFKAQDPSIISKTALSFYSFPDDRFADVGEGLSLTRVEEDLTSKSSSNQVCSNLVNKYLQSKTEIEIQPTATGGTQHCFLSEKQSVGGGISDSVVIKYHFAWNKTEKKLYIVMAKYFDSRSRYDETKKEIEQVNLSLDKFELKTN